MQTRLRLLHIWGQQLRRALPAVRATRVATLALFSFGILWQGSVTLLKVAAGLPLPARDPSTERRLRRWLANPRVVVSALWPPLLRALLADRAGAVWLVFDPSPLGAQASVLVIGLIVHRRILPLAWRLVPSQRAWPAPQATLVRELARQVAAALPPACSVTLLVDRGVTGAELIDLCRELGWHFVFRLSADARQGATARTAAGWQGPVWDLVTGPGQRWYGPARIFQAAGWRAVHLTIVWPRGYDEPWLLLSDRPAGWARVRDYRYRARCEATFEDCKRRGWDVERTRVTDRERLDRLLPALSLALWWAQLLGLRVLRRGLRRRFDRADRRDLSLVRLGRRWLAESLDHDRLPPLLFRPATPAWRCAWRY